MDKIINSAIDRFRAVILVFITILVVGTMVYSNIPKESAPDIQIPTIYVSMKHDGISPDDAERLLVKPMEKELKSIVGVKEMRSTASSGQASVLLEFNAGFDSEKALRDVREKVDLVKIDLPDDTDDPIVNEVNLSLFPVLNVILTSNLPERDFLRIARRLRDKIEGISEVLSVDIAGDREETVDVIIKPIMLESYGLTSDVIEFVKRNNRLIAAGSMDTGKGRYNVKVPGLIENINDILNLPIKVNNESVVTLKDVADISRGFKDPLSFARVNGRPAIVLEVSKRSGENIIETVKNVRKAIEEEKKYLPHDVDILFSQDESGRISDMVEELQNNVLFAIILVIIIIIASIGIRSAFFIAISIPGSFLIGILIISLFGVTLNIVVLFGLILSIGMLVDSAIIIVEYANRKIIDGELFSKAYAMAAKRMSWPIIASTLTTLIVFTPLLFWPGIVGQFMKYLPMTLIAVLGGSLLMALIFLPTIGSKIGKADSYDNETKNIIHTSESGDIFSLKGFTGKYVKILDYLLKHAVKFTIILLIILYSVIFLYKMFGAGVEFFPDVETDNAQVLIHARGNFSVYEKDKLVKEVEKKILGMQDEIRIFYTRAGEISNSGSEIPEDVIGIIHLEFVDWKKRRKSREILADIKNRTASISGIIIETKRRKKGPPRDKPIEIEISSIFSGMSEKVAEKLTSAMHDIGGFIDIQDTRTPPAIEWEIEFDRVQASRFGVDVDRIGNFIKLVTNGLVVTSYRPDDSDDEVDVVMRFPRKNRGLSELDNLRIITNEGAMPISNFVKRNAKPKTGRIQRTDGVRIIKIAANLEEGILADKKVHEVKKWLENNKIDEKVKVTFKGEDEKQDEAKKFLIGAFVLALLAMSLVLIVQFNSIYHTIIIMSAVFLSTIGVLFGLLVTSQPFGIVMCGVGTIALAGIVVNNNIIFIDTYKLLRNTGMDVKEALLRTGAQRIRPILLTAITTVLGLIPMVLAMNINFITREITFGAPSSQWWQQLSTSIAGGLTFATILTLFFTPCLIFIGEKFFLRCCMPNSSKFFVKTR